MNGESELLMKQEVKREKLQSPAPLHVSWFKFQAGKCAAHTVKAAASGSCGHISVHENLGDKLIDT